MNLNSYDRMAIKNAAKACSHFNTKKQVLVKKQEELQQQINELDNTIAEYSKAVIEKTGFAPLDLVEKVGTTWVFKYPDTLIPTENETEKKEEEEVNSPVGLGDKLLQAQEQPEELPQVPEEVIVDNIEKTEKDFVDPFNNLY